MSLPRQVIPGRTYLVTRRCSERRFFLLPSRPREDDPRSASVLPRPGLRGPENEAFLYDLGLAAKTNKTDLFGAIALSNHWHGTVGDPEGRLPRFAQQFHANHARCMNLRIGHRGAFWEAGDDSYSAVHLVDSIDVFWRQLYIMTNAVAAGLVDTPEAWPGVTILPEDIGEEFVVVRPTFFFRSRKDDPDAEPRTARDRARRHGGPRECLPDVVRFRFVKPPQFAHLTLAAYRKLLRDALDAEVAEIHERRRRRGLRSFLGVARVLAQSPFHTPETGQADGQLNPRVACKDRWKRIERLQALAEFWQTHRIAFLAFRSGRRRTLFPAGTWQAVKLFGARARAPT